MMSPVRPRFLLRPLVPVALTACLYSMGTGLGQVPPQAAETRAVPVEQQAHRWEKKEGKHDRVPDAVTTKTTAAGEKVIEQVGEASFYSKRFQGRKTASGKRFHQRKRTAAHRTLPLGTEATVTNLQTGQSTEVQITDRGPYAKGRDLDLSKQAAQDIGLTKKKGEAPVEIEAPVPPEGTRGCSGSHHDQSAPPGTEEDGRALGQVCAP